MNVTQLQQPPPSQVQRVASEAEDVTPDFLSIKLVSKRGGIRISPKRFDLDVFPGKAQLLAVSNLAEWFAAVTLSDSGFSIVFSPLAQLRAELPMGDESKTRAVQPQRVLGFATGTPNHILYALNETRLVVALVEGPVLVYDTSALHRPGTDHISPLHSFPPTTSTAVRQISANPGDLPDLVALLREPDGSGESQLVEVLNVATLQSIAGWRGGGSSETFPTSISWSPKGKQMAIGLQSGDIITFSPTEPGQVKMFVPSPPSEQKQSVIHTSWLSNPSFYNIFAAPGALDPQSALTHILTSYDSKRNSASDISMPIYFFPNGLRAPGTFTVTLRNWDPAKIMLVVGDSVTADIAVIGYISTPAGDVWQRLSSEDAATPSMPLDTDQQETVMIGFEMDVKNTQAFTHITPSGEELDVPPPPIIYAYGNDGVIVGWFIVNTRGTVYPGMSTPAAATAMVPEPTPRPAPPSLPPAPTFGQPFGTTNVTPSTSSFGQSAFGNTGFGSNQSSTQNASAFGASQPSTSSSGLGAFGSSNVPAVGSSSGFAAFASSGPSAFGRPVFDSPPATTPPSSQMERAESQDMMSTDSGPSFGGLSLGQSNTDPSPKEDRGALSMFGTQASEPSQTSTGLSSFGESGGTKFSSGFGLYAQTSQPKPTVDTQTTSASEQLKPSSSFGQTGFGTSAFGQSGFAGKSTFGQSAFGQSAFGKPAFAGSPMSMTPQPSPATTTSTAFGGGGFASFASGGPSSFKPTQNQTTGSAFGGGGGFASFASGGTSSFVAAAAKPSQTSVPAWRSTGDDKPVDMTPSTVFGGSVNPIPRTSTTPPATPPSAPPPPTTPPAFSSGNGTSTTPPFSTTNAPTTPASPSPGTASTTPSAPPPANAFSGLKSRASPFGNSGAFASSNAFGSFTPDSPFANPKPVASVSAFSHPVSAFATSTTPPTGSSGSVFGQPSSLGGGGQSAFGRSGFGTPSTPSPAPSTTPTTTPAAASAFSAFSSATSAFGKPASSGKSFSELLQDGKPDGKDAAKDKEMAKVPAAPSSADPKALVSAFPRSVFSKPPPPAEADKDTGDSKGKQVVKETSSGDFSTGSLSMSSSFVEVSTPLQEDDEGEDGPPTDDEEEGEEVDEVEGEGQSIDDFLSDTYSDEPSQVEEGEDEDEDTGEVRGDEDEETEEEEELDDVTPQTEPTSVPLPASRSPTVTPQQPRPSIFLQPTTPDPADKKKPTSREQSTTPPGSPTQSPSPALLHPTPTLPSPSPSPTSGIGLGRPSTRPTRSSPLANSIAADDEDDEDTARPSISETSNKPRPASPKTPFGLWSTPTSSSVDSKIPAPLFQPRPTVKTEPLTPPVEEKQKTSPVADRPKTPPAQSLLGSGSKSSASTAAPTTKPATMPPPSSVSGTKPGSIFGSIFGSTPAPAPGLLLTPASKSPGSPFGGLSSSAPSTAPKQGGPGPSPTTASSTPGVAAPSTFGHAPAPKPSLTSTAGAPSSFGNAPPMIPPAAPPRPAGPPEHPMQVEFGRLFISLAKDLEELGSLAKEASRRREEMINSPPTASANSLHSIEDITRLDKEIVATTSDLVYLETSRKEDGITVRELETGVLRAKTRREEIVRFNKAKSDAEFSKMLQSRFLSPEHVELQTQLRRNIRAASDRISQMEEHLQAAKKMLDQVRTGKARVKSPSLDTVNRTSRNIDIAIEQQAAEIDALLARVAKLNLDSSPSPSPSTLRTRDKRLPDSPVRPPTHVTQDVATTTAAALNAEQSAQKLKDALLKVRREPLLNTQASAAAPTAPKAFASPTPAIGGNPTPFSAPFTLPPFNIDLSPTVGLGGSRHRAAGAGGHSKHQKAVPLKRAEGSPEAPKLAPPPAFDWGPLPSAKPMASLAFDLRSFTPK
ncbi:hypothetical protein OF83DRAFT_1173706 [Amylostereum chailletii]|nr:hypothetical protein OF83DRAFT_1173706 [Amylostereum chailletii]